MKLSIITVNLNNLDGLRHTIESVENQVWRDFEWIVIDGGSTDGSKELIEEHAASFAYWISEPDKGIYNAMNKGILKAQGEWIQFLNSGDWLHDTSVLANVFSRETEADIMYGYSLRVNGKDSPGIIDRCTEQLTLDYFMRMNLNHQSCFYRRQLFEGRPYNENFRIVADWERNIAFLLEGKVFESINRLVAVYDSGGISSQQNLVDNEIEQVRSTLMRSAYLQSMVQSDHYNLICNKYRSCHMLMKCFLFLVRHIAQMHEIIIYEKKKYSHKHT